METSDERPAIDFACPTCQAEIGDPCKGRASRGRAHRISFHRERWYLWEAFTGQRLFPNAQAN